jgi:hypothetical protein
MIARSSSSFFSPATTVGDGSANPRFSCRCRFPGAFMRVPVRKVLRKGYRTYPHP